MKKKNQSNSFSIPKSNKSIFKKLLEKVSDEELREHPEITEAIKPKPIIFFEYLRQEKMPMKAEALNAELKNKKQKCLSEINNVRLVFNDCLKFQRKQKKKISLVSKLTQNFCKDYEEYKDREKKANINQSYLFDELSLKYEKMNYKLPNIKCQGKHNVFRQNPLIEKRQHLESYYKYHREPHVEKKAMNYIKKVYKIAAHRSMANSLTQKEDKPTQINKDNHTRYSISNNKDRDLSEEILKHQSDIKMICKSIDEAESIDDFYTTKEKYRRMRPTPIQLRKSPMNSSVFMSKNNANTSTDSNKKTSSTKTKNNSFEFKPMKSILKIKRKSISNLSTDKKSSLESIYEESLIETKNQSRLCDIIRDYFHTKKTKYETKVNNTAILKDFKKKKNVLMNNIIAEAYDIQRGKNVKIEYPPYQLNILEQNSRLERSLCQSEKTFWKLIHDPELGPQ